MRYTYTYSTSGDVQTALSQGSLNKPYVAYITGENRVDYNSMESTTTLGEWEDVYGDHTEYTLTLLNESPEYWGGFVFVGTISGWYQVGSDMVYGTLNITITGSGSLWTVNLHNDAFDEDVTPNSAGETLNGFSIVQIESPDDSDRERLVISYNNTTKIFSFYGENSSPLSLTPTNPSV